MPDCSSERGLRIGIVTDGLEERTVEGEVRIANGGVGVYIYELIRHLLEMDAVELFLIRYLTGRLDIYRHPRARPIFLSSTRGRSFRMAFNTWHRVLVQRLNLDLLHYPNQFGGLFLPKSIRRIATLHDVTPLLFPAMHPYLRILAYKISARLCLRRTDQIITVSDNSRRDLASLGIDPAHITTIYPGVAETFTVGTSKPSVQTQHGASRPYMLTVGVLEPRKNQRLLLEVLEILNRAGHDLELIIVGRPGWRWTDPLADRRFASLRSRVRILEDVPAGDLIEYYRHAKVFAYPSFYEGFGLPILEAMACGTPVVCSNTSSLPEAGGDAALYSDPHDSVAFAGQVARVLNDQDLRRRMVEKGLEHVRRRSWKHTALATLDLYRSVCRMNGFANADDARISSTANDRDF